MTEDELRMIETRCDDYEADLADDARRLVAEVRSLRAKMKGTWGVLLDAFMATQGSIGPMHIALMDELGLSQLGAPELIRIPVESPSRIAVEFRQNGERAELREHLPRIVGPCEVVLRRL